MEFRTQVEKKTSLTIFSLVHLYVICTSKWKNGTKNENGERKWKWISTWLNSITIAPFVPATCCTIQVSINWLEILTVLCSGSSNDHGGQPESFADPISLTKSLHGQAINSIDDGRVSVGICCDRVEGLYTSLGHDYSGDYIPNHGFLSKGGGVCLRLKSRWTSCIKINTQMDIQSCTTYAASFPSFYRSSFVYHINNLQLYITHNPQIEIDNRLASLRL